MLLFVTVGGSSVNPARVLPVSDDAGLAVKATDNLLLTGRGSDVPTPGAGVRQVIIGKPYQF